MATEGPVGMSAPLAAVAPLDKNHDLSSFDCGAEALNEYLRRYAYLNHQNRSARTYVAAREAQVAGYYTLAAGSVSREDTPQQAWDSIPCR